MTGLDRRVPLPYFHLALSVLMVAGPLLPQKPGRYRHEFTPVRQINGLIMLSCQQQAFRIRNSFPCHHQAVDFTLQII